MHSTLVLPPKDERFDRTRHYLHSELLSLNRQEPGLLEFLEKGGLDGMWFWDLENPEIEWMSPKFWELLGVDHREKQHLASEWQEIVHQDDLQVAIENFTKHCADPSHPYDQIVRYRHTNGSTIWVRCRGIAIRNNQGKAIRMLGVHTDVTALKRTERMLEARTEELVRANEALARTNGDLERFASMVAHDLKSPLHGIANLAGFIRDDCGNAIPAQSQTFLKAIGERVTLLSDLVSELLTYAQNRKTAHDRSEEVVATALLNQAVQTIDETTGMTVHVDTEPFTFRAIRPVLDLVLRNLLNNAVNHHDRATGVIRISAEHKGDFVEFAVADDGPGIDPKDQERVFELFRTVGRRMADRTGMGLAMVKRAVDEQGGSIWVESEGRGSVFRFTWPVR